MLTKVLSWSSKCIPRYSTWSASRAHLFAQARYWACEGWWQFQPLLPEPP